eukprot:COSAG06_NODE_18611_length_877_cov_1.982005_2_plen_61_part_00
MGRGIAAYMEEGVHCLSGRALDVNDIRDDDVAVSLEPGDLLLYHRVLHHHIDIEYIMNTA